MEYSSSWRCPSNIALIKYWGKHDVQLPNNPSLSFTLSSCHTDMKMAVSLHSSTPGVTVFYDGRPRPAFEIKIKSYFSRIHHRIPWLKEASVFIDSVNTFPHGAGIASSASSMGALALCLADIDEQVNGFFENNLTLVSEFARLGSGSACRSVFPVAALWGRTKFIHESSDDFAIPWSENISVFFQDYQDTILIVSDKEKAVSSTMGHELMTGHAYAEQRYEEAGKNLILLLQSMKNEPDVALFISVVESEALQLHALMMSGGQPFMLIEPGTVSIIKEVWRFRKETNIPLCFTLDAGPNVHLLYPAAFKDPVLSWIKTNLLMYCHNAGFILDEVGKGPVKLSA